MATKRTRAHAAWRLADYHKKLTKKDAAYLEKFESEFHRCEFEHQASLHSPEQKREIIQSQNVGFRDVFTRHTEDVIETRSLPCHPSAKARYYTEQDYAQQAGSFEDALIEAIDSERMNSQRRVVNF